MVRLLLTVVLFCMSAISVAQQLSDTAFVTISGTVRDKDSKKPLGNVGIYSVDSHICTVSNNDGTFSITIPAAYAKGQIRAEQLGYYSSTISLSDLRAKESNITIVMASSAKMLKEVIVRGGKPDKIVAEALMKIPVNYPPDNSLFTAFL